MRKVAVYARVSTEHEAQLSALDNQIQYYDNIISQHPDWVLYDRYIDEGITGTSTKKRPSFMRMLSDAEKGRFDLIITREVSRFARNTVDTLQETRNLKKIGVEVYFTEDHIWTMNDDDGELKLTLMATLAQNESRKTSQRVKAGQKISFENGVIYGTGNILGYDKVGKEFIINEEQAKTVKMIYDLYLKGNGIQTIKFELEKLGCKTATGKKLWHCSCISSILKNSFYCGIIEYRKYYIPDYLEQKKYKNNGQVDKVYTEGKHTPLVSKEDFNRVQELLEEKKLKKSDLDNTNMFGGKKIADSIWGRKLVCKCGSNYNKRLYHKYSDGHKTYCYQCYSQKNNGTIKTRLKKGLSIDGICDSQMIQEWKLDLVSKVLFDKIWNDREQIKLLVNDLLDKTIFESNKEEYKNELNNNKRKLELIENKLSNSLDAFISELITKEEFSKMKQKIEKEKNDLIDSNNVLEEKINNCGEEALIEKLKILKTTITESLNFDRNNISSELIDSLIEKITVYNNRFIWKLKGNILNPTDTPILLTSIVVSEDHIKRITKEMNLKIKNCATIYIDLYY